MLIPLKNFSDTGNAKQLILNFLSEYFGSPNIRYDVFDSMNKAGLFVIFLDGFDEMARRVTRTTREEHFYSLDELCAKNSKVIITGRPGYFPNETEFEEMLKNSRKNTLSNYY